MLELSIVEIKKKALYLENYSVGEMLVSAPFPKHHVMYVSSFPLHPTTGRFLYFLSAVFSKPKPQHGYIFESFYPWNIYVPLPSLATFLSNEKHTWTSE